MTVGRQPVTRRSTRLRLWSWIGYWLVLFAATHLRVPPGTPTGFRHSDKLMHFAAYFVLARLGASAIFARGRLSAPALMGWGAVYLAYAASDEWLQQFTHRQPSLGDWLADAAGVMTATVLVLLRQRRSRLSEPTSRGAAGESETNVTRD